MGRKNDRVWKLESIYYKKVLKTSASNAPSILHYFVKWPKYADGHSACQPVSNFTATDLLGFDKNWATKLCLRSDSGNFLCRICALLIEDDWLAFVISCDCRVANVYHEECIKMSINRYKICPGGCGKPLPDFAVRKTNDSICPSFMTDVYQHVINKPEALILWNNQTWLTRLRLVCQENLLTKNTESSAAIFDEFECAILSDIMDDNYRSIRIENACVNSAESASYELESNGSVTDGAEGVIGIESDMEYDKPTSEWPSTSETNQSVSHPSIGAVDLAMADDSAGFSLSSSSPSGSSTSESTNPLLPSSAPIFMSTVQSKTAISSSVLSPGGSSLPVASPAGLSPSASLKKKSKITVFCEICDKGFPRKCDLNRHVKSVHIKIAVACCEFCGQTFTRSDHLLQHHAAYRSKCTAAVKNYACSKCGMILTNKQDLERHYAAQHDPDSKPFKCEVCGSRFSRKDSRRKHLISIHKISM